MEINGAKYMSMFQQERNNWSLFTIFKHDEMEIGIGDQV